MSDRVGVIAGLNPAGPSLKYVADFGLKVCQINHWNPDTYSEKLASDLKKESEASGVRIASLWAGWPGPAVWDFVEGPETLGLVPKKYRAMRMDALKRAADFAKRAGLPAIVTHMGYIPENARDPVFLEMVEVVREIGNHAKERGVEFWFETGQETPVTLLRLIEQAGTGNLGINLDPANLILYGKANPIDALDVFGRHVKSIHAKDGMYPTDPMKLGHEVKVGQGKVRFPEFVSRLEEIGYRGPYIIEREISGPQQQTDIADTVKYLSGLLAGGK